MARGMRPIGRLRQTLEKQRHHRIFRMAPLISVVVPAYLTPERFLRQMLDSLLRHRLTATGSCVSQTAVRMITDDTGTC